VRREKNKWERKTRAWEIAFTELVQHTSILGLAAIVGAVTLFDARPISLCKK
jgi:hypothetical protein